MGRTKRKRRRRSTNTAPLDHEAPIITLRKFMSQRGFLEEPPLKLRDFPGTGRGVASTKTLQENDILISIPYNLLITYNTVLENQPELFHPSSRLKMHDILAVFLGLEHHKKSSLWRGYLDSLPQKAPELPLLLSLDAIKQLPVDLRLATGKSRRLLEESWTRLKKSIRKQWKCDCCDKGADRVLTWNLFTWGYILVNTRAVYVDPNIVQQPILLLDSPSMALCPFLDMFNHSYFTNTKAALVERNGKLYYQLTTMDTWTKFNQIFISYGAHNNQKLLLEYGFFIPGNYHDCLSVQSDEVIHILGLSLDSNQTKFIQEHNLGEVYIDAMGPNFNLRAFLFIAMFYYQTHNCVTTIYNDSYSKNHLSQIQEASNKLLLFKLNTIQQENSNFSSLINDYLRYRKQFLQQLFYDKQ